MKAQNVHPMFQVSEIKVSYQPNYKASERPKVTTSGQAYQVLMDYWDSGRIRFQEQCFMLLLNCANRVIGIKEISSGGVAGTVIDPKLVFGIALKCAAYYVILAHNHPSGNLAPSTADLQVTKRLVQAGQALDLQLLDHLIVTTDKFYSFRDQGLI